MKILALLFCASSLGAQATYHHHGKVLLPDPAFTPGAVLAVDTSVVCRPGYATRQRQQDSLTLVKLHYSIRKLYAPAAYGRQQYDHLVPIELGGASVKANLWEQPYIVPGALQKDLLENKLHRLVCNGTLSLVLAQQLIIADWYAAYLKYKP